MDKEAAKKLGQQLIAAGRELIDQNSDELDKFEVEYDIPNFYKHWRWKAYKLDSDSWWFEGQATDKPSRKLCEAVEHSGSEKPDFSISKSSWFLFRNSMDQRHNAYVINVGAGGLTLRMPEEDAIKFVKLLPEIENRSEVQQLQAALDALKVWAPDSHH